MCRDANVSCAYMVGVAAGSIRRKALAVADEVGMPIVLSVFELWHRIAECVLDTMENIAEKRCRWSGLKMLLLEMFCRQAVA